MLEVKIYKRTPLKDYLNNIKKKIEKIKRFFGVN